jgi:hypothetical protein
VPGEVADLGITDLVLQESPVTITRDKSQRNYLRGECRAVIFSGGRLR